MQLNFFDILDQPPPRSAEILAFPSQRMVGAIRLAADSVVAARSRRKELDRLEGVWAFRLYRLGVAAGEIERSTIQYRQAIVCELLRRSQRSMPANKGDAA